MNPLTSSELDTIASATYRKTAEIGLRHAQLNQPLIARTVADLDPAAWPGVSAIVVAAGPSLHRTEAARRIRDAAYRGAVIACDGALGSCLREGLVPDFVVSVDPHPTRIVRWFGDPDLASRADDDYFRRQDLDPYLNRDEQARNQELLELVNRHGPSITALLSTSVSPTVSRRIVGAGMPVYWWNPIYDDYDDSSSTTRKIFELTGAPCLVTGGNCGTSAWVLAGAVLARREVAVVGMDLGYPPDTPLERTQYYQKIQGLLGDRAADGYIKVWNPHLQQVWCTDPTYWWYRESFLALARRAPYQTSNCTAGGILFGEGVLWEPLSEFLSRQRETDGEDSHH